MKSEIESMAKDQAGKPPQWSPAWATQLADLYFSGVTCMFVLHGNVHDLVRCEQENGEDRFVTLEEFLTSQIFGGWGVVVGYDLGSGMRLMSGSDSARLQKMVKHVSPRIGNPATWPRTPEKAMAQLERLMRHSLLRDDPSQREELAVVLPYAQYLIPTAEISTLAGGAGARLVRMLGWAQNPYIRRLNIAFCLIVDKLSEINERLVVNPHVATIEIPLPAEQQRQSFVEHTAKGLPDGALGQFTAESLARLSSGLNLVNLNTVLSSAKKAGGQLNADRFKQLKKKAIERQCQGLVEFIEPKHDLEMVVGHQAAKNRLREDARMISSGHLDASPMGYLVCGPVGTGKSFLAECYAGTVGIPCVKLRNFRSKYVGETEGNLEQVLTVLRSLGPILVIIDEADAMLGDRRSSGDSGTSGRVFSMIASQMGDTRYRGRIIWMLLTCRPDLLPIDLKRQGRAEVHIPLFYPQETDELHDMFRIMARKNNVVLADESVPNVSLDRNLSGADVESVVLAARRKAITDQRTEIGKDDMQRALDDFIPSAQGLEKELQETVAVLECTDTSFLTSAWREQVSKSDGRSMLQERSVAIRQIIED